MRDIITQAAIAFILWSLAVELTGWAMQRWLGENWWRRLIGERELACETEPATQAESQLPVGKY